MLDNAAEFCKQTELSEFTLRFLHLLIPRSTTTPAIPASNLAFLDFVATGDCVRDIKQNMIRSHTKGIYASDRDSDYVREYTTINKLADVVEEVCEEKTYGFARLYPRSSVSISAE